MKIDELRIENRFDELSVSVNWEDKVLISVGSDVSMDDDEEADYEYEGSDICLSFDQVLLLRDKLNEYIAIIRNKPV